MLLPLKFPLRDNFRFLELYLCLLTVYYPIPKHWPFALILVSVTRSKCGNEQSGVFFFFFPQKWVEDANLGPFPSVINTSATVWCHSLTAGQK